jgi:hypothetical protein
MYQLQRSVPSLDVDDIFGMRSALGGEVLERPTVLHQHLFDSGLMQRRIHGFAKARVLESAARPVDTHRRAVDDDAHRLRTAHEQPGPGIWRGGQANYSSGSTITGIITSRQLSVFRVFWEWGGVNWEFQYHSR